MSHINKIKWYMEMQYNDIQIIIKQYGRTGTQYSYFVYFNLSDCSCKYILTDRLLQEVINYWHSCTS